MIIKTLKMNARKRN
ncbi:hypothetical protein ACM425_19850 [Escherichia coli]|nr:hypothetical protein [Escherichia coli]MEC4285109.1 hypothetical protein [Escherichia coli]